MSCATSKKKGNCAAVLLSFGVVLLFHLLLLSAVNTILFKWLHCTPDTTLTEMITFLDTIELK